MNDKIVEYISEIDSTSFDEFLSRSNIDSKLIIDSDFDYDFSWLPEVEEYLPFIANIVNQDYSATDDSVIKSYENRFVRTLVIKLKDFLDSEYKKFLDMQLNPGEQRYRSHVNSLLDGQQIEIDVKVSCTKDNDETLENHELTIKERIERLISINDSFLESELVTKLSEMSLVHTINKTEIFTEDINYRKCLELYNIIYNYTNSTSELNHEEIKKKIDEKAVIMSYLEYQLLNEIYKEEDNENVYKLFLERLIEKMVQDTNVNEKNFKKMLTKKFEEEYAKKKKREITIQTIFDKTMDNYNKQVKDAIRALKS